MMHAVTLGLALTLGTLAAPASAAIRIATYAGTIQSGYDETGVFGVAGRALAGLGYSVSYRYDTSLGIRSGVAGAWDEVKGGLVHGVETPVIETIVTIAGFGRQFFSGFESYAQAADIGPQHLSRDNFKIGTVVTATEVSNGGSPANSPFSLETVYPSTEASDGGLFSFTFYSYDEISLDVIEAASGSSDFSFGTLTYQVTSVPEPGSWVLLIAGFVFVGTALRRTQAAALS